MHSFNFVERWTSCRKRYCSYPWVICNKSKTTFTEEIQCTVCWEGLVIKECWRWQATKMSPCLKEFSYYFHQLNLKNHYYDGLSLPFDSQSEIWCDKSFLTFDSINRTLKETTEKLLSSSFLWCCLLFSFTQLVIFGLSGVKGLIRVTNDGWPKWSSNYLVCWPNQWFDLQCGSKTLWINPYSLTILWKAITACGAVYVGMRCDCNFQTVQQKG